jgi:dihydrofolate reductase
MADTNLVIMGSGVVIGSLMAADLIDEYVLMIAPLVLGTGRRLFPDGARTRLRLLESSTTQGRAGRRLRACQGLEDEPPLTARDRRQPGNIWRVPRERSEEM